MTRQEVKPSTPRIPFPPIPGMSGAVAGADPAGVAATVAQVEAMPPNLGKPAPLHLRYAENLRDAFSEKVRSAAREPLDATALFYAMLLSPDEALRAKQLAELARRTTPEVCEAMAALWPEVADVVSRARLPLVNLALPALRRLRPDELQKFSQALQWLIVSDDRIGLFEFVLQKIVRRRLAALSRDTRPASIRYHTLKSIVRDCAVVLSALANTSSSSNAVEVERAFKSGAHYLRAGAGGLQLLLREACGLEQLDTALDRLSLAAPNLKKNVIEACVQVVSADGLIQEREAELLRAIADMLECPIPPFVDIAESLATGEVL